MENGVLQPAFYEILEEYERRFEEAEKKSSLPESPDMEEVEAFVERINRRALTEEFG